MIGDGSADDVKLELSWAETVALDYGQFAIVGSADLVSADLMSALDLAQNGDGIGQVGDVLVVISPHQNNFAMPLRVEVWSAQPLQDLDDWQDAFDAGAVVGSGGISYESPTVTWQRFPVPEGRYRLRVTGRGFVTYGWPGSTAPGDEWRIQLWPNFEAIVATRVRVWDGIPLDAGSSADAADVIEYDADPFEDLFDQIMHLLFAVRDELAGSDVVQDPGADHAIQSPDERFAYVGLGTSPWSEFVECADLSVYNLAQTRHDPQLWSTDQLAEHKRLIVVATAALPSMPSGALPFARQVLEMLEVTQELVQIQLGLGG